MNANINSPATGKSRPSISVLRKATTALVSCAVLFATSPQFATVAHAEARQRRSDHRSGRGQAIKLGLNKSIVIDLPADAYDILVANPAVADAVTRTARRIYLFGKSVGQTNIFVFGPNGEQIANLQLEIERDVAGLEDYLERFCPIPTSRWNF